MASARRTFRIAAIRLRTGSGRSFFEEFITATLPGSAQLSQDPGNSLAEGAESSWAADAPSGKSLSIMR